MREGYAFWSFLSFLDNVYTGFNNAIVLRNMNVKRFSTLPDLFKIQINHDKNKNKAWIANEHEEGGFSQFQICY